MRLFIAIDAPTELEGYYRKVQKHLGEVRPTSSFHLTLKFLGDYDKDKAIKSLEQVNHKPFGLSTSGLGAFPSETKIRVLWAGIEHEPLLFELADKINDEIKLKDSHRFHPHITLARVNKKIEFPDIELEKITFSVSEFVLYQSILTPEGPKYKVIKKFKL